MIRGICSKTAEIFNRKDVSLGVWDYENRLPSSDSLFSRQELENNIFLDSISAGGMRLDQ